MKIEICFPKSLDKRNFSSLISLKSKGRLFPHWQVARKPYKIKIKIGAKVQLNFLAVHREKNWPYLPLYSIPKESIRFRACELTTEQARSPITPSSSPSATDLLIPTSAGPYFGIAYTAHRFQTINKQQ